MARGLLSAFFCLLSALISTIAVADSQPSDAQACTDGHLQLDLSKQFPDFKNQGQVGTCTYYASAALIEAADFRKRQRESLSPSRLESAPISEKDLILSYLSSLSTEQLKGELDERKSGEGILYGADPGTLGKWIEAQSKQPGGLKLHHFSLVETADLEKINEFEKSDLQRKSPAGTRLDLYLEKLLNDKTSGLDARSFKNLQFDDDYHWGVPGEKDPYNRELRLVELQRIGDERNFLLWNSIDLNLKNIRICSNNLKRID